MVCTLAVEIAIPYMLEADVLMWSLQTNQDIRLRTLLKTNKQNKNKNKTPRLLLSS